MNKFDNDKPHIFSKALQRHRLETSNSHMRDINTRSQLLTELSNLKHSSIRYKLYAFGSPILEKLNSHKTVRKICQELDETEEILEVFWIKSDDLVEEMNVSFVPTVVVFDLKNEEVGRVVGKGISTENIYKLVEKDLHKRNSGKPRTNQKIF